MRVELADLNHCAVPFLSRAAVNFIDTNTIHSDKGILGQRFTLTTTVLTFWPKWQLIHSTLSLNVIL